MLNSSEVTMEENILPTTSLNSVPIWEFHTSLLSRTVHSKMEFLKRKNRTIMEKARSMLHQAKLPLEFWAEACSTAVYLLNRSLTTALKNETPFEHLAGTKPDITHLKVFGCVSNVHVPNSKRRKLDAKARKAIFVGYPPGVKGYKLYDLEKKSFVVSRDVTFFEQNFDHFEEEIKSKEAVKLDLSNMFPKVDEESESSPEHSVKKEPVVPEHPESPVPKQPTNKEPAVPKHLEPSVQVKGKLRCYIRCRTSSSKEC